jgi:CRISPR-associated protein Csx17
VSAFIAGQVDDARIIALARPLMAITWWTYEAQHSDQAPNRHGIDRIDAAYAVLRLTHLSERLRRDQDDLSIPLDPEPLARLASGDLLGATAVCLRRLRASGLAPTVRKFAGDARYARRLGASLAFHIRAADLGRCAKLVTKPYETEEPVHVD